ncbi:hypothetical protein PFISCL1PPCAC_14616 [Pristionchus fissidentatus]|uniref:Oligopeptide transporter 1 n=1 Tax=Pristionchus fissidentatus TaxID=1538716 RepID=A0AAV5W040_9BILA|nr:hypothetical protein PFISCL1PPCAC_14616 [Pristionchus fissidentatus]
MNSDRTESDDTEKNDHDEHRQPEGFREIVRRWPKKTLFIIGNEFCERFSYYGMRAILTIYLINFLGYGNNDATVIFHGFTVLAYTTPLFGSMLADGYIGKYWTIFFLSIVYAIGQVTLAAASYFPANHFVHKSSWLDFLGLVIIAIGTGGIKPCVSSFGGDQFHPSHTRMISIFFSLFYFSINAGSTLSMFITPIFRHIPCLGQDSCFPLAFGVPAVLMLVATGLFMVGSFWYKRMPPTENVIWKVASTIVRAIMNKRRSSEQRQHWLDHALDDHDCVTDTKCMADDSICAQESFVTDVKSLVRVVVMMTPFPMFWALYDQQGSRWTIQAMQMNSRIVGGIHLLPDQMQVLNAILILIFIPFFQAVVYPLMEKLGIKVTMLRKMAAGGLLAALTFVLCALVQTAIQGTLVPKIEPNSAHLTFVNTYPSDADLGCAFTPTSKNWIERSVGTQQIFDTKTELFSLPTAPSAPSIFIRGQGANCPVNVPLTNINISSLHSYSIFLTPSGYSSSPAPVDKPQKGGGEFGLSIVVDLSCSYLKEQASWASCDGGFYNGAIAVCDGEKCDWEAGNGAVHIWNANDTGITTSPITPYDGSESTRSIVRYPKIDVKPATYSVHLIERVDGKVVHDWPVPSVSLPFDEMGSVYTAVISEKGLSALHRSVPPNTISIFWQIPQYIVITAAEVLFSVTGLEFAYAEAAPTLKSVVSALYLLTVAFGDIIIIVIAHLNLFNSMVTEMLAFAFAMLLTIGVFILLAIYYYEYAHYDKEDEDDEKKD